MEKEEGKCDKAYGKFINNVIPWFHLKFPSTFYAMDNHNVDVVNWNADNCIKIIKLQNNNITFGSILSFEIGSKHKIKVVINWILKTFYHYTLMLHWIMWIWTVHICLSLKCILELW